MGWQRWWSACALGGVLVLSGITGCDEEESGDPAMEQPAGDIPDDACLDGNDVIAVGETRTCGCPDGTRSSQTCLSTGEFGNCACADGGW